MKVEKKASFKGIATLTRNNSIGVLKKSTELENDALKANGETTRESNADTDKGRQGGREVLKKDIFEVKILKFKSFYFAFDFEKYRCL
jgi:hypothetical protein